MLAMTLAQIAPSFVIPRHSPPSNRETARGIVIKTFYFFCSWLYYVLGQEWCVVAGCLHEWGVPVRATSIC